VAVIKKIGERNQMTKSSNEKIRNEEPWKVAAVLVGLIVLDIMASALVGHASRSLTLITIIAGVALTGRTFYYQHRTMAPLYKVLLPALTVACVITGIVVAAG
jgi:hypothetical protein